MDVGVLLKEGLSVPNCLMVGYAIAQILNCTEAIMHLLTRRPLLVRYYGTKQRKPIRLPKWTLIAVTEQRHPETKIRSSHQAAGGNGTSLGDAIVRAIALF